MRSKLPAILISVAFLSLTGTAADKIQKGVAEVNGTKLYYELAGSGIPIVLIHGWSFDSRCWDYQFPVFSRKYRVLRYDLRGFGKSQLPELDKAYSHAEDLAALMDYFGIQKAHILGHSFGGKVAIEFALRFPERIISLILPDGALDVIGYKPSPEIAAWLQNSGKTARESGLSKGKEVWISVSSLAPALKNPRSAAKVRQMIEDYSGWHWFNKNPVTGIPPYPPEKLGSLKVPALIIVGELNPEDILWGADIQEKYIPNSKKVIIPGVGHALNLEDPIKFNRIVLGFLKEISK